MKKDIRKGYAEQRRRAYPSIADQLDAIFKGGEAFEEMRGQVASVKTQYPKPKPSAKT